MKNGHGFGPADWSDEGLPIIRIQNLNGGRKFDYFSRKPEDHWLVETGDLLFSWAGSKGVSFGPFVWHGPRGVLNQHIFKVKAKASIDVDWLYWALRHVTDRIEGQAHGFKATLVHVKKSDIDRQPVRVPGVAEQRRIARILATWDEATAVADRLTISSAEQSQALLTQVLAGKRRLGRAQTASRTPTARDSIPRGWRYLRIGDVAGEVSQKLGTQAQLPVLSCTKHQGLVDSLSYFKKRVFSVDTSTYKVAPRGSFVYATNHIEEGSIGYQDLYDAGLVSPMYTVFKTSDEICDAYLYALLKTEDYRQVFASATNASVDRRGSLRWKDFRQIHVPVPPLAEQEAIAAVIEVARRESQVLHRRVEVLREEKTALMAQLLTGKRRVLVAAAEGAA